MREPPTTPCIAARVNRSGHRGARRHDRADWRRFVAGRALIGRSVYAACQRLPHARRALALEASLPIANRVRAISICVPMSMPKRYAGRSALWRSNPARRKVMRGLRTCRPMRDVPSERERYEDNCLVPDLGITCSPPTGEHLMHQPLVLIEILSPPNVSKTRQCAYL